MEMEELKKLGASMKETADAIEVSAQKEINQFQGTADTASTAISSVSQSEIAKKRLLQRSLLSLQLNHQHSISGDNAT